MARLFPDNNPTATVAMLALLVTLVSGCGSLLQSEAPPRQQIWLEAPQLENAATAIPEHRLRIQTAPGLNGDQLLKLTDAGVLAPVSGLYWPGPVSGMVADLMESALARLPRSESATPARNTVGLTLEKFFIHNDSAVLQWRGTTPACPGQPRQVFNGSVSTALPSLNASGVAQAFESNIVELTTRLVEQMAENYETCDL